MTETHTTSATYNQSAADYAAHVVGDAIRRTDTIYVMSI